MNCTLLRILASTCMLAVCAGSPTWAQQPGTKLWQLRTDADVRVPAAVSPDGSIYVTSGRKTYALNSNGEFKWQLGGDALPPVVGADGTLYLITGRRFHAIDSNGKLLWRFSVDEPLEFECCAGIAADGTIYLASEGETKRRTDPDDPGSVGRAERLGRLYSVTPEGQGKWRLNFSTLIAFAPIVTLDSSPMLGLGSEKIAAYTSTAVHRWNVELSDDPVTTPAIGPDGTLYVTDNKKIFYAITSDGKIQWTFRPGAWLLSSPAVGIDGAIYFGCDNRRLYALNPDGTKKWEFVAGAGIRSSPALAADGTIYFGCVDHKLYALSGAGELLWTFTTGGPIFSSPNIDANGDVLIGSDDNTFYAIKGTSPLAKSSWPKYRGGARQSGQVYEMGRDSNLPTPLRLTSPVRNTSGFIELSIMSAPGVSYQLEGSSDLHTWTPLSTSLGTGTALLFSDSAASRSMTRFYRIRVLP